MVLNEKYVKLGKYMCVGNIPQEVSVSLLMLHVKASLLYLFIFFGNCLLIDNDVKVRHNTQQEEQHSRSVICCILQ